MKKKMFSLLALLLFTMSFMSMAPSNLNFDPEPAYSQCYTSAQATTGLALFLGFPASVAYEMGNDTFQDCVNRVDIQTAAELTASGML